MFSPKNQLTARNLRLKAASFGMFTLNLMSPIEGLINHNSVISQENPNLLSSLIITNKYRNDVKRPKTHTEVDALVKERAP